MRLSFSFFLAVAATTQAFVPGPVRLPSRGASLMAPEVGRTAGWSRLMAMKDVGVGIIGAGRIGIVHLEALAGCPSAIPVIISNPTVAKAQEAAVKFNVREFTDDAMKVIQHPDVDAVWICSPSQYHADQIKACAAAGKHVFCEKPIATGLAETIEAINTCREAGVKLMTALQRRFDPNFARVKRAILEGEVGNVVSVKLTSRDPSPPPFEYVRGGGGIFKDMAVHDLDMSRFLMGTEPESILALGSCHIDERIGSLPGAEAFDTAVVIVKYPGGKTATIDVCRQAPYGYDQRAEVLGLKGMIATDNMYPNTARIFTKDSTRNADLPYDFFMSRYKDAYL
ncbi:oxidoreductase, partial [Nannochloropsis gaditana]